MDADCDGGIFELAGVPLPDLKLGFETLLGMLVLLTFVELDCELSLLLAEDCGCMLELPDEATSTNP